MSQWFKGKLEGYYVGTTTGSATSQSASAERYKLRIYRALVRDIKVLSPPAPRLENPSSTEPTLKGERAAEPASEAPIEIPSDCFYQAKIEDSRLFGIRPRSCFEGTIYDVAVSQMQVTHSTKEGNKTYGRVTGEMYARFVLPIAEHEEMPVESELRQVDEPVAADARSALSDVHAQGPAEAADRGMEPLHPPTPPRDSDATEPSRVPVPFLVLVLAIALALSGGATPALLWLGVFTPLLVVRLILGGQFKVNTAQRIFGAILVLVQFACLGLLLLEWWELGCKSINPWALGGIGIVALLASVLPSPIPLLCAGASLALVLFLLYSEVGVSCDLDPAQPTLEEPAQRPGIENPGVPRTNSDGSWPRRPPRRTQ